MRVEYNIEREYASLKAGMRSPSSLRIALLIGAVCLLAHAQDAPTADASSSELKGMPPRATPADYQAHTQAGAFTVGAEFMRHSVPTPEATYSTEDYIVVEVGLFAAQQTKTKLSVGDFSLRLNGKKAPLLSQPYGITFRTLKDPEWEPPTKPDPKSKPTLDQADANSASTSFPTIVRMPIELKRTMQQRVQKAAMPEGDRALPQAGLLFFEYRGKPESIRSLELVYSGPAGNVVVALQP